MSLSPPGNDWLIVHLYYNEPWETFLKEAVKPYFRTTLQTGITKHYFFTRSWQKGPNIRLFFHGESAILESILKPNLIEHFESYFETKPSIRKDPISKDHTSQQWIPNHSIIFEDNFLELDQYNEPKLKQLLLDHYQSSTNVTLDLITKGWTYNQAMGASIKLQLSFAKAIGMGINEIKSFFSYFYEYSLEQMLSLKQRESAISMEQIRTDIKASFKEAFDLQRQQLIPFHREMIDSLSSEKPFEQSALNEWINDGKVFFSRLQLAVTQRELFFNENQDLVEQYQMDSASAFNIKFWPIFRQMLELSNNRLGILRKDYAFTAYLIKESLIEAKSALNHS